MARGKKFNDDIKEKALAMLATNNNTSEVAKQLGIKESTLRSWKNSDTQKDEFAKLRLEKKKEFVEDAWDIIKNTQKLIKRKINRALDQEDELDLLMEKAFDEVEDEEDGDAVKYKRKQRIASRIEALKIDNINQLSVTLGTLYDKQALATDEPTVNVGGRLEELIKKVEGKSEY